MHKRVLAVAVMFLVSVVLTNGGTGVSYAAGKKETSKAESVRSQEPKKVFDAHETHVRYHFKDSDMDFTFGSLVLGATVNHGCEIGEAFRTAANIKDGDAASWQEEWAKTARRVAARGEQSLAGGHRVSARDQLQRASYYYRLALLAMLPDDPRLREYARESRSLLKKAGELFDPPLEYFEIPFEGTSLPGFFRKARKAAAGTKPVQTLIMIGGGETFAEDLFFYIAPQAYDRGYNFMTVDLPGQGLLPLEGKVFRRDMQVPMKAVVDYALGRPEVDPQRLAVYGYSGGGGFVPQAAMHDQRIKAIAMNSCVVDARPLFATMPVVKATPKEIASWSSFHGNTVKLVCWRWGVPMDKPAGLVEANEGFRFDPAKVAVPALVIVGEGEYQSEEVKRQQQMCMDNLPNLRKKFVVTPASEGAANHCVMENRSLMSQVVFDWLDELFQAAQPKQLGDLGMNDTMQLINTVAMVWTAFFTAVLAGGIWFAYGQVRASKNALKAQVLLKLFDEWRSPKIYRCMTYVNRLRDHWKSRGPVHEWNRFAREWVKEHAGKKAKSEDKKERELWDEWVMRRTASQFLGKMGQLIQAGYLTADEFFKVNPEVARQLMVLIPIEIAIQEHWSTQEGDPVRAWDVPFPKWEFTQLFKDYLAWYHHKGSSLLILNQIKWEESP